MVASQPQPFVSSMKCDEPVTRCFGEFDISGLFAPPICGKTFWPMCEYVEENNHLSFA